jgi:hypothetical protein
MTSRSFVFATTGWLLLLGTGCGASSELLQTSLDEVVDSGHVTPHLDSGIADVRVGLPDTGQVDVGVPKEASVIDTGIDTSLPGDAGPYPATFPDPPQVVNALGPVLTSPKIVAILFNNDDATEVPQIESFMMGIGTSKYWNVVSEYGVGPATAQIVSLNEAAPATIDDTARQGQNSDLQNWLLGEITAGTVPEPDANTEYMIVYPATTTITEDGTTLCGQSGVGGYHTDIQNGQTLIAYGVLPRCAGMGGLTDMQIFTGSSSHEIVEAATDPYPDFNPAWSQCDNAHIFWDEADFGSEVGDMCEVQPEAFYQFPDFPFVVQRIWSNQAARMGTDPCQPEYAGETYFAAVPVLPDLVSFPQIGNSIMVSTKKIAVGASGTVELDLYSEGPTQPWTVTVQDFNYLTTGNASSALLSFSMPQTTGQNGTKLPVTITVNTAGNMNTNGQIDNSELFLVEATQGTGNNQVVNLWWGMVSN